MKNNICVLILMCLLKTAAFATSYVHLDSLTLANAKTRILEGTASAKALHAYKHLITKADQFLLIENPTVVDKTILPPSGDLHDYLSISRYWWPDAQKKDGLPWIRKDGKTNPDTQTEAVDRKRLGVMGQGVRVLSLAYYFTNEEVYAQKAISMIDTWFINPKTRMNAHLEYAQSVPGNPEKRRSGILDGRTIVTYIPDAITLLSRSEHWNSDYKTKTTIWFTDYLTWLTKSELGIKGSLQENNHGSWYKYQVATLAYYLDDKMLVKNTVIAAQKSLEQQLNDNGGQIQELERSRSFFYSCFNLRALVAIAELGTKEGMDLWHYESKTGKSLQLAINYLTPVVEGSTWKHDSLKGVDLSYLIPILSIASTHIKSSNYERLLSLILENEASREFNTSLQEYFLLI